MIVVIFVIVEGFLFGWSWKRVEQSWKATGRYPQNDQLACTAINQFSVDVETSQPVSDSLRGAVLRYGYKAADLTIKEATLQLHQAIDANSNSSIGKALKDYANECDALGLGLKNNTP